jgi:hypothetical protein
LEPSGAAKGKTEPGVFLEILRRYKNRLRGNPLALEMDSGYGSALIFDCLSAVGINPALIGSRRDRFRFRVPRRVGKGFLTDVQAVRILNERCILPFTRLELVPAHPVPSEASLFFARHEEAAVAAQELGLSVLLHGLEDDAWLTVRAEGGGSKWRDVCRPWLHSSNWANEFVYRPKNVEYLAPCLLPAILRHLGHARKKQLHNLKNIWMYRNVSPWMPAAFEQTLSGEVSGGGWEDGLEAGRDAIHKCCSVAANITACREITPRSVGALLARRHRLDEFEFKDLTARLSFAVWIAALARAARV